MALTSIFNKSLARRDFLAVLVLVANAFSWYFPLYVFFENTLRGFQIDPTTLLASFGVHYAAVIGFAVAGASLAKRFRSRDLLLCLWMIIGAVVSALLVMVETKEITYIWLMPFFLGGALGLGFPSCLAYFGDFSTGESRGRLGGIVWFASGICMLMLGLVAGLLSFTVSVLVFAVWRGVGAVLFLLLKPDQIRKKDMVDVSYKSILIDKSFLLYLISWTMFCLINFLEIPITNIHFGTDIAYLVPIAEFGIGGVTALIWGWVADSIGRKRVIIFGFLMLGIGYAVLGLFPYNILSWYIYIILDGGAWGIFALMFYLVIWAELAGNRVKEKYYLTGVLPFLTSSYLLILFPPYAKLVAISAAFSLASFFLFLAVLPLLYAPETLSEKEIEKRRLQKYLEDVKKVKMKHEK